MTYTGPNFPVDEGQAASILAQILHIATYNSTGPTTNFVQPAAPAAPAPTTGAAPTDTSTTAPDSGGANNAVGIPKDTASSGAFNEIRVDENGVQHMHPGIDLSIPVGTPLVAAMAGKITVAGNNDPNGYGNFVEITTSDGMQIRYGHLSAINVAVGDTVKAGQLIGKSGGEAHTEGAGNSTGPHLHFEVDINGQSVDPTAVLAGGGQIVKGTGSSNPAIAHATTTSTPNPAGTIGNILDIAAGKTPSHNGSTTTTTPGASTAPGGATTMSGQMTGADSDPNAIDAFLAAIKQHESGGDYTARNPSGQSNAAGAYQFIGTTWQGLGGSTESAADASPEEQDRIARAYAMHWFDMYHSWRLAAIAWYQPSAAAAVARGEDPGAPEGQGRFIDYGDEIARMMGGG